MPWRELYWNCNFFFLTKCHIWNTLALMLSITCQKSDFLMPSNGNGCMDRNSFYVYFSTPWTVVISWGKVRKSIMARFEDLQFWNRGTISDRLAKMDFLGLFLRFDGSSGPMWLVISINRGYSNSRAVVLYNPTTWQQQLPRVICQYGISSTALQV